MFNFIHIELTSRCQKACAMCGRRKMERDHPELCDWGDMSMGMVRRIAAQVPSGTVVQLHGNGEPTLYPRLHKALVLFKHCIRQFNTNAINLNEVATSIIGNLEVLTISVIPNDPLGDEQHDTVKRFLDKRADQKPQLVYRLLGDIHNRERWDALPGLVATRVLHDMERSANYRKPVTIPEIGICLDLLAHLAIDRYGNISMCVRFDPDGDLRLGNIKNMTLQEAWNGEKRQRYIKEHTRGNRNLPGCSRCDFYGCPVSPSD